VRSELDSADWLDAPERGKPRAAGIGGTIRNLASAAERRAGLPETDAQGATLAADKIRRSIASHDFSTSGNWRRITVSCGAATIDAMPRPNEEAGLMNRREYMGDLLREAYHALETGRSSGTNRTSVGAYRS